MGTNQKTDGIEKVKTYQTLTTVTKSDTKINTSAREPRNKIKEQQEQRK